MLFEIATLGPGFTDRRAARDARRGAVAAAELRAVPRRGREDPHAAAEPARGTLGMIVRERPAAGEAAGRARALPRARRRRARPLPAARRARPRARAPRLLPARRRLTLPPGGAHWYVVPRVGYPDVADVRRLVRGGRGVARLAAVLADRAGRVLAGLRDGACAGARRRPAAAGRDLRLLGLHPGGRRLGARHVAAAAAGRARARNATTR